MKLTPKHPPGRANRKARAFAAEIARLATEGYSCEAIREALSDVGVQVSASTVRREIARAIKSRPIAVPAVPLRPEPVSLPSAATPIRRDPVVEPLTGKQIAEEFMRGRVTNPLMRRSMS